MEMQKQDVYRPVTVPDARAATHVLHASPCSAETMPTRDPSGRASPTRRPFSSSSPVSVSLPSDPLAYISHPGNGQNLEALVRSRTHPPAARSSSPQSTLDAVGERAHGRASHQITHHRPELRCAEPLDGLAPVESLRYFLPHPTHPAAAGFDRDRQAAAGVWLDRSASCQSYRYGGGGGGIGICGGGEGGGVPGGRAEAGGPAVQAQPGRQGVRPLRGRVAAQEGAVGGCARVRLPLHRRREWSHRRCLLRWVWEPAAQGMIRDAPFVLLLDLILHQTAGRLDRCSGWVRV